MDGQLFIDMRLIDGIGLDTLLTHGPLAPAYAVAIVSQVSEALDGAHRSGLVHRDVKPSNILVTPTGFAYLVEFGIPRTLGDASTVLTQTGVAVGTFAYIAPERFEGAEPDPRSDVYSLASVLAECLTGSRPFDAASLPSLMRSHFAAEPPRPSLVRSDIPAALDHVVAKGMAKIPLNGSQAQQSSPRRRLSARDRLSG